MQRPEDAGAPPAGPGRRRLLQAAALGAGGVLAAAWAWHRHQPIPVRLALPVNQHSEEPQQVWPASKGWPGADFLPLIWKLDEDEGIAFQPVLSVAGRGALHALLDDQADLAFAAPAAVVNAIAGGAPVQVLAITTRATGQIKLLTRREHAADWLEKPIAYSRGTVLESALLAQLAATGQMHRFVKKQLALVNVAHPKNLIAALLEGRVQTAVVLKPFADFANQRTAPDASPPFVDVSLPEAYLFEDLLVTTRSHWQAAQRGIVGALRAVRRSREMAAQQPARTLEDIRAFETAGSAWAASVPQTWKIEDLVFQTQAAQIQASLQLEARLRQAAGLLAQVPDYADNLALLDQANRALAEA